jgi:hypothetical protein
MLMHNMKSVRQILFTTAFLLVSTGPSPARVVRPWPYQELLEKSDLVVIANPSATNDTKEHIDLPGFAGQPVISVETRFTVSSVLKGDKALKDFVLYHYRPDRLIVPDGPSFISFTPSENPAASQRTYLLFLLREASGRYTPVVGQADPGLAVMELAGVYSSPAVETQTRLGLDIANVLKECQTLKPGMTRAELSKVLSTEGGLSTVSHRTYVYRDCPYIKVDVDFSAPAPNQDAEKPADIVTKVSKPYLDWTIAD